MTVPAVPDHKHCEICGTPVVMDKRVCSGKCQKGLDEAIRAKKRGMYIFIGLILVVLLLSKFLAI